LRTDREEGKIGVPDKKTEGGTKGETKTSQLEKTSWAGDLLKKTKNHNSLKKTGEGKVPQPRTRTTQNWGKKITVLEREGCATQAERGARRKET